MKKIILLVSILLLIGAGCAKTQPQEKAPNNNQIQDQNEQAANITPPGEKKEVEFEIHFPSFIPEGLKLNEDSVSITDKDGPGEAANYQLEADGDDFEKRISIRERKKSLTVEEKNSIENKTEVVELLDGFIIITKLNSIDTNHVIFSTKDGHMVQLSSNYFDSDTLVKVAKSMDK